MSYGNRNIAWSECDDFTCVIEDITFVFCLSDTETVMTSVRGGNVDDISKTNLKKPSKTVVNISLSSKTQTETELWNFVKEKTRDYIEYSKTSTRWIISQSRPTQNEFSNMITMMYTETCVEFNSDKMFKDVFIDDKSRLVHVVNEFKAKKIPKLNIFLHGEPGTGKTSIAKALANELNRSIVKVTDIYSTDFLKKFIKPAIVRSDVFTGLLYPADTILLFEDIDADGSIFKNRNVDEEVDVHSLYRQGVAHPGLYKSNIDAKANLAELLNIFDGVYELHNTVMVFTTNHKEMIDPAVYRPGRMNLILEVSRISIENSVDMIKRYYEDVDIDSIRCFVKDKILTPAELEIVLQQNRNSFSSFVTDYNSMIVKKIKEDADDKLRREQRETKLAEQSKLEQLKLHNMMMQQMSGMNRGMSIPDADFTGKTPQLGSHDVQDELWHMQKHMSMSMPCQIKSDIEDSSLAAVDTSVCKLDATKDTCFVTLEVKQKTDSDEF